MSTGNDIKNILNIAKNTIKSGKTVLDTTKASLEISKLQNRQNEHKINIGKIIFEKEIQIDDSLIKSNIKAIRELLN